MAFPELLPFAAVACTRKDNLSEWGFPGGKLDPGETPADTIRRELFEETGLIAKLITYLSMGKDDSGHMVSAWAVELEDPNGNLLPEVGIKAEWVDPHVLTDPTTTPYGRFQLSADSLLRATALQP